MPANLIEAMILVRIAFCGFMKKEWFRKVDTLLANDENLVYNLIPLIAKQELE